jgi:nucleoside-diphosphate-sugar epimerase
MAHYLLSGAAGFIAARVAEMLLDAGHTVLGVDNLNHAYDVSMKEHRLARLNEKEGFDFRRMDIADRAGVESLHSRGPFDGVINLAARAGVRASTENPWVYVDTNVTGTLNLLELCRHHGAPKFVQASTSSVYGQNAPLPTPETADSSLPLQPYAASKVSAEALCHAYHFLYDLDVTVFRYFTVYGPSGRPDMSMFRFVKWIIEGEPVLVFGDGEQSRGFTYVDDIARGTILGLKPLGFEIINLGGHESITINKLIRMIERQVKSEAHIQHHPAHPADMRANLADVSKAGRLLGWEPQIPLSTGVTRLVEWYRAERGWASQVQTGR